jgi:hypothetical protein
MSFLFGGGRPQPTSEQKIAAAEAEVEMVSDMFNRCVGQLFDIIIGSREHNARWLIAFQAILDIVQNIWLT